MSLSAQKKLNDIYIGDCFFPFQLSWFITLRCNNNCNYCFVPDVLPRVYSKEVSVRDVLSRCRKKGIFEIHVLGGEPFLEKATIIELARQCGEYKVVYRSTSTNGLIYDKDCTDAFLSLKYPHILQVSLDAASAEVYAKVRGNGMYNRVVDNTRRFVDAGLNVVLSMVINKENICEVEEFIRLAERIGVESVSLGTMIPIGRGARVKHLHLDFSEIKEIYRHIHRIKTKMRIVLLNELNGGLCGAGLTEAAMLPDGSLYPCGMFLWESRACIGNIMNDKLNKEHNDWFLNFANYRLPTKCTGCKLPPICDYACKAVSYKHYGRFKKHEPFCVAEVV